MKKKYLFIIIICLCIISCGRNKKLKLPTDVSESFYPEGVLKAKDYALSIGDWWKYKCKENAFGYELEHEFKIKVVGSKLISGQCVKILKIIENKEKKEGIWIDSNLAIDSFYGLFFPSNWEWTQFYLVHQEDEIKEIGIAIKDDNYKEKINDIIWIPRQLFSFPLNNNKTWDVFKTNAFYLDKSLLLCERKCNEDNGFFIIQEYFYLDGLNSPANGIISKGGIFNECISIATSSYAFSTELGSIVNYTVLRKEYLPLFKKINLVKREYKLIECNIKGKYITEENIKTKLFMESFLNYEKNIKSSHLLEIK
ncbi:MAG: hypothetical protein ABIB46_06935 [bacterium]